ncbi:MAG: peptidase S41, partial [Planctomycetota bacterium]|nr:peptidase S41 [Planctomycetota bacterium]
MMLRFPDISEDRIVFSYANDLWTVPREGGLAQPLASPAGTERMPRFSPDGSLIAFSGNYDGNVDLYVVPVEGGVPHRATYHPEGEIMLDWTPGGDLMFQARNYQGNARISRLFTTSPEGGLPQPLPVPYGSVGAISGDGQYLAYTPWTRDGSTWKRYRGGMATDLWLIHLPSGKATQLTDWEGTDTQPMWHGNVLYFLSDAGPAHRKNIWTMNHETGDARQVTFFKDHDVQWPTVGPGLNGQGEIIMQAGTGLHLLDLETEDITPVHVTIPGDRPTIRTRRISVEDEVNNIHISPSAQRLVLEARGDIWSLPVDEGPARNLTRSSHQADRDPSWSPDGQWIAFFSDRSGEYELWMQQSDGREEARQITTDGGVFKHALGWNPDGTMFAFGDMTGTSYLYSVEDDTVTTVDQDPIAQLPSIDWS